MKMEHLCETRRCPRSARDLLAYNLIRARMRGALAGEGPSG